MSASDERKSIILVPADHPAYTSLFEMSEDFRTTLLAEKTEAGMARQEKAVNPVFAIPVCANVVDAHGLEGGLLVGRAFERAVKRKGVEEFREYHLLVEPKYDELRRLSEGRPAKPGDKGFRGMVLSDGLYYGLDDIQEGMQGLEYDFMRVLAEKGAEHAFLTGENRDFSLLRAFGVASGQPYGEALCTARSLKALRSLARDDAFDFQTVTGRILPLLLQELHLPFTRTDTVKPGFMDVKIAFDKDAGVYHFTANDTGDAVLMTHAVPLANDPGILKERHHGPVTAETFQKHFTDWVFAAARERRTISNETYGAYTGRVTAYKGVSLESQLPFSPPVPVLRPADTALR